MRRHAARASANIRGQSARSDEPTGGIRAPAAAAQAATSASGASSSASSADAEQERREDHRAPKQDPRLRRAGRRAGRRSERRSRSRRSTRRRPRRPPRSCRRSRGRAAAGPVRPSPSAVAQVVRSGRGAGRAERGRERDSAPDRAAGRLPSRDRSSTLGLDEGRTTALRRPEGLLRRRLQPRRRRLARSGCRRSGSRAR